ncbi:MAG: TolC family protein [Candidatus Aminicenantes bacterium]|jgi:outer membrane protein TolC|nr:TolC family protein [Candidatus Aminicenantes bacterium]
MSSSKRKNNRVSILALLNLLSPGFALAILIIVLTSSCIQYHPHPLSPEKNLKIFEDRRLDSEDLANFLKANREVSYWPPNSWDLKSLTLVAFYYNLELDVARASWSVARSAKITAGEIPNPTINPKLGYNSTTPISLMPPWIPEMALDLPLEVARKRGLRLRQASHLATAARWNLLSTAWKVRYELREALIDLYAAENRKKIYEEKYKLLTELVKLSNIRKEAGEISGYELSQFRMALNSTDLEKVEAERALKEARTRLASILGIPLKALEGVVISFDDLEKVDFDIPPEEIRRQALLNRTDILSSLSEYAATEAALRLEIAKQYPDLHFGPTYQLDQTDNKWTIGLSLELPVFSHNRGPIAEAEARRKEKAAEFLALQSRVLSDLEMAIQECQAAKEKMRTADFLLENIRDREQMARSQYQAGEISKPDFLNIEIELQNTALLRLETLIQAQKAYDHLENALQSPLQVKEWVLTLDRMPGEPEAIKEKANGKKIH